MKLIVLIIFALMAHGCKPFSNSCETPYHEGDVVYLKPDSMPAVITVVDCIGDRYYIQAPGPKRSVRQVYDSEIYGIKH